MDVNPVQLSPEVKMPQFIVSRVNFTLWHKIYQKATKEMDFFFTWKMFIIYLQTKGVKLSFVCFQVQDVEAVLCDEAAVLGEK